MQLKRIYVTTNGTIPLGRQGENMVRQIVFPQPAELMQAEWTLSAQRSRDSTPYPVALSKTDGEVVWDVTSADTAMRGLGKAQLMAIGASGEILLSRVYTTDVQASLDVAGDPPDPVKPWYDSIIERLDQGGDGTVKSVNGIEPDENGNVEIEVGSASVDLDATLSAEAKAADAKAVGDALKGKQPVGDYALKADIPAVPVKSVNGKTGAVNLTAEDVGALPASTKIPAKTSDLTNDSGFIAGYTETDPTVPAWAKAAQKPTYSATEVGAEPKGTADSTVNAHNTSTTAHADIRKLIDGIAVPTKVSQLTNDAGYLTQHQDISGKLDADKLPEAVNSALAQAKASGEFDGEDGYTPVKGVDYWTDEDKQEIIDDMEFAPTDALAMLAESGIITPVVDDKGKIYTLGDKILVVL